jgi:signal transduction histidine kinase
MKWVKKLFHPIITFIGIQLIWGVLVFLWIYWFIGQNREIRDLASHYRPEMISEGFNWPVLLGGIAGLLIVLVGVYVIFLYWKRQSDQYRRQKDIISQVTHELKSPLASIQLHLETMRLRALPPEKTGQFLDTMLADVDRLNNLINNLLMAARLEHRRRSAQRRVMDFSAFVADFLDRKRSKLPEGGSITCDLEEKVPVSFNAEEMETALRNLYENAVLYSPSSPEIHVTLKTAGRKCLVTFADKGKGIEPKQLRKVFRMFYRVRSHGENIRGTGLGLYIVKSIITAHGGSIRVTSEGVGTGSCFHITLPRAEQP